MVADFAFLQQKIGWGICIWTQFLLPRQVERLKVCGYHYKLSYEVVLGAGEISLSPLRNLSLLNCTSLLEIILLFEIINYPGHFMPIHYNQNKYIYQFEDGLQISRGKNDVLS